MNIGGDDYAFAEMMNAAFGTKFSAVITEGSKDNEVLLLNGSCDPADWQYRRYSGG